MTVYAKDIMVTDFDTVNENASIDDVIEMILNGRVRKTGHKSVSLMVVNDGQQLVGVITMFDILYHLRPDFLNYGIDAEELQWFGQLKTVIGLLEKKTVKQVMSPHVVSAQVDEHIMVILDRMIKNKYRRLPVLKNNKPIGVIYISDIYCHIFKH